jgi:hypothetical protein
MIRIVAKLLAVTFALAALLQGTPLHAAPFTWAASNGTSVTICSATQPCVNFFDALAITDPGGQVNCLNSPGFTEADFVTPFSGTVDCVGSFNLIGGGPQITLNGTNQKFKIRNATFTGNGGRSPTAINVTGSGTLILENCVFENFSGIALDIEPNGPLNLVIRNSRISNGTTVAIVLKPAAGGSINATFDHVTVTENGGGGIRLDTTNGPVTADVTDSVISNNTGNGLSAQGGAGGAAMLSIHNSVVAKNGAAGVNATGATGAAMIDTTLLDSNTNATSVASGGHILTYGNNRIVGPAGSGFTGTASLN